jgi:hypothetical protein
MNTKSDSFKQWQEYARSIDARVERLTESIHNRGWKLAKSVGIGRCGCSLHNASIDDNLTGWCSEGGREMLKVAKRANLIVNDWSISDLGECITRKAYNRMVARPCGWLQSDETPSWGKRPINVALLFACVSD